MLEERCSTTAATICQSFCVTVRAGAAGRGADSGLAGVWQQQTAKWQPQLAGLAKPSAPAKKAVCVNNSAKASSGANMVRATFITVVILLYSLPSITRKQHLSNFKRLLLRPSTSLHFF
jgi:hypothetical protein